MVAALLNGLIGLLMSVLNILLAPLNMLFSAVPGLNYVPGAITAMTDLIGFFPVIIINTTGIPIDLYQGVILGYAALLLASPIVSLVKWIIKVVRGF